MCLAPKKFKIGRNLKAEVLKIIRTMVLRKEVRTYIHGNLSGLHAE